MKIRELVDQLEADADPDDEILIEDGETGYLYDFQLTEAERPHRWMLSPFMDGRMEND